MSDDLAVNLTSLNIIKPEFLATIQQATSFLEQFIGARDRQETLEACIEQLAQLDGAVRIVQLHGADVLTRTMLEALRGIPVNADESWDDLLAALSAAIFVLARYFEYAQQYRRGMPVLLLPFINEVRLAMKQPALPDSHFFHFNTAGERSQSLPSTAFSGDGARRFRHMYQVGLLGILQGQNAGYSLGMMQRALERTESMCGDSPFARLLWAAATALLAMREQQMTMTLPRKMMLSALDRQLKQLVKQGESWLSGMTDEAISGLFREFVFIAALSGCDDPKVRQLRNDLAVAPIGYTEEDIETELANLRGPGLSTVQSVAEVIKEELRGSKLSLEMASQSGGEILPTYPEMIASLTRIADILAVVGLASPSQTLREQIDLLRKWEEQRHEALQSELVDLADTLLYIESTVAALQNINLSHAKLAETNAMGKDQIIARSQLADAERVVLDEAQAGLGLIKRAIGSYVESGYDRNHIANLGKSLNSVRGALLVLGMNRAAKITDCCIRFVEEQLMRGDSGGAIQQLLETFADAVISLEYFVDAYIAVQKQEDSILDIAEESIVALGYSLN